MGTQLMKLNGTTNWILEVKRISKMFKNHVWQIASWQIKHVQESWPKRIQEELHICVWLKIHQWDVDNNHMGTQLMKLNETTNSILEVKRISKMFKNHAWQIASWQIRHVQESWPKRIQEELHICVWLKIHQGVWVRESKSKRCKTCNAQTIFDDAKAKTRMTRALATCTDSPTCPKARLHPTLIYLFVKSKILNFDSLGFQSLV